MLFSSGRNGEAFQIGFESSQFPRLEGGAAGQGFGRLLKSVPFQGGEGKEGFHVFLEFAGGPGLFFSVRRAGF